MIPYEPHPILFSLGPLAVRYYSLAYIAGFLLAYRWLKQAFNKEIAEDALTWIVLGTIIGGRVGYFIFYSPATLLSDPLELFRLWHGGMSFHGGLIGITAASAWFTRLRKIQFWEFADIMIIPAAIGLGLGRIANFLNGELVGTITNVNWCMQFPGFNGCRHPSQLYEAAYSFAIAGIVYWQSRKKTERGYLFAVFLALYGISRFLVTFLREDPRWFGLSEGQYLSLVVLAIGVWLLGTKYKKSVSKFFS